MLGEQPNIEYSLKCEIEIVELKKSNGSKITCMCFKSLHFFHSVVVVDSNLHIICTDDDPLFSSDKFSSTYYRIRVVLLLRFTWEISNLK